MADILAAKEAIIMIEDKELEEKNKCSRSSNRSYRKS